MTDLLARLIESPLGYSSFRPYQEAVCRAAVEGKDSLLVMPTGAGKSLCYQLPGLVMKGTTLVISPLIALMEDQVLKMQAKGLKAERIHAGRDRAACRQVCFDYLDGKLDFLYIAPERLGVPNFPEMLAKKKPVLVAVDEAHCISQWGHDFRPDYRRLRERLQILRPCPIMAVTATATKTVQDDIVKQLDLKRAKRFIHGFRRDNIAIEAVEMTASVRDENVLTVLQKDEMRPAIVYAPTRKSADTLGGLLASKLSAEAYHAGLSASERDRIQKAFIDGELDVIVATIAFGMGIDKADVRTVIHTALPGSVEGYYQEIGRAGRDGKMSRAILLHSYADRRTHDFFYERDYPKEEVLQQIYEATSETPISKDDLVEKLSMDLETFERALEKLWIHQGVEVDFSENIKKGSRGWRASYEAQRQHKVTQLDQVSDFVKSKGCRMGHLVRHFGDDEGQPCAHCDFCAIDACVVKMNRELIQEEVEGMANVFSFLKARDGISTGQLHQRTFESHQLDRRTFEDVLDGLARAGYVRVAAASFEKDGKNISFQRVHLTPKAQKLGGFGLDEVSISQSVKSDRAKKKKRGQRVSTKVATSPGPLEGAALETFKRLRDWRLAEAKKREVPAFCVLTDRVMRSIAQTTPTSEAQLMDISGFGPKLYEKHGSQILEILRKQ